MVRGLMNDGSGEDVEVAPVAAPARDDTNRF
jgi:hypothetical protein